MFRTPVLILFLLLAAPAGLTAGGEARVVAMTLEVRFEPGSHRIEGRATLDVEDGGEIVFRLHEGLDVTSAGTKILSDEVEGYWRTVRLAGTPGEGLRGNIVEYSGTLYDAVREDENLSFVIGDDTRGVVGEEGIFLVSGSGWYPVAADVTTFRSISVDVPEPFVAVTQGKLVSRKHEDGREKTVWRSDTPMDGLALQAGEYVVTTREVLGVRLSTYLFAKDQQHSKLFLDEAESYLRFYVPLLGPFPWPKFDIVENFFTTGYGMPSYTLLGDRVVTEMVMMARRMGGRIPPGFIDHEMVHCWWGNSVYPDYATGNWCEGLTSYYSNYLRKERDSLEKAVAHRKKISTTYAIRVNEENEYTLREFRGKTEDFENQIGYGKGTMFFHMLRRLVGADVFFGTMREIARDFAGRKASWDDFRDAFTKASGEDLSWFFTQWLDRKGAPRLLLGDVSVARKDDGTYLVRGVLRQDGDPYVLDVPVTVEHAGGESFRSVRLDGPSADFEIVSPRPPLSVSVDKRFDLFRQVPLSEIQPCLNLTLERQELVYVVPEGDAHYGKLAAMAKGGKGGEIVAAGGDLPKTSCVLFGRPEENPAVASILASAGVTVEGNAVTVKGKRHEAEDLWLLLSVPHPEVEDAFVTVFFGVTKAALARARVIFHYGWDGFLVYAGRRPLDRGDFTEIEPETVRPLPLAVGETGGLVETLAGPDLAGRRAGTRGGAATRKHLAAALAGAGVEDVREVPFSFTVLDVDDEDAWTTALGTLEDGATEWSGSFPGAVVPAVFSPEAPEGVAISRIVPYGEEVKAGDLVVLPPEKDPAALFLLLRMLDGSGAAAAAIPMGVLADRGAAPMGAFPSRIQSEGDPLLVAAGMQARSPRPDFPLSFPVVFADERILPPGGRGDAKARLRVRFRRQEIASANLVGTIPGAVDGKAVGLSAHFDGLGEGHQGADDNASGVAAVIGAARALHARKDLLGGPVRVILFGAEEWGLRGSTALAPEIAGDLSALVNLDTVGAKDQGEVYLIGRSHHPELAARAAACLGAEGLAIGRDIDRFAFAHGSDHWPFHVAGVPALDLYSGQYRRMNTKADTLDLVSPEKVERIARATARLVLDLSSDAAPAVPPPAPAPEPRLATVFPGETHLRNIRMLTTEGENAEAYFPAEEDRLIFQRRAPGMKADQIFLMNLDGTGLRRISNGKGATTCSYLFPGSRRCIYATTALAGDEPPAPPDLSHGYVWKLHPEFDIVAQDLDGSNFVRLTDTPGYDAEGVISRDGRWIVFTSCRSGDPEIYRMRPDGSEVKRLTHADGYDGGAFFSFDGRQIVWRANRPKTEEEKEKYEVLRKENLISPMALELYVMDADGGNQRRITDNGAANFGPFFHPDGKRVIFCSNLGSRGKRGMPNFDLWIIGTDGKGLERVTHCPDFDGFPMFDSTGRKLVFCSNRDHREGSRDTNVFLADWVD